MTGRNQFCSPSTVLPSGFVKIPLGIVAAVLTIAFRHATNGGDASVRPFLLSVFEHDKGNYVVWHNKHSATIATPVYFFALKEVSVFVFLPLFELALRVVLELVFVIGNEERHS